MDFTKPADHSFVGGVRWASGNATIPLARLDINGRRLRVSLRGLLRRFPGTSALPFEMDFDEIEPAQAVGSMGIFTSGIRLRQRNTGQWVIFWSLDRDRVLSSLEAAGIEVIRTPIRFSFWNPGR